MTFVIELSTVVNKMKSRIFVLLIFIAHYFTLACNEDEGLADLMSLETKPTRYKVTFLATWSSNTHPLDFPSNPHFSGLIGMTHAADTTLFRVGKLASTGIKNMAETGSTIVLKSEIEQMIHSGSAQYVLSGGGIGLSPSEVSFEFDIDVLFSKASIVSMIAPSPDWFIGIASLDLYKEGKWISDTTVYVKSYDAGTDNGITFTSNNEITNPYVPVFEIIDPPLIVNGVMVPLGTMTFTRIND